MNNETEHSRLDSEMSFIGMFYKRLNPKGF